MNTTFGVVIDDYKSTRLGGQHRVSADAPIPTSVCSACRKSRKLLFGWYAIDCSFGDHYGSLKRPRRWDSNRETKWKLSCIFIYAIVPFRTWANHIQPDRLHDLWHNIWMKNSILNHMAALCHAQDYHVYAITYITWMASIHLASLLPLIIS